MKEQTDTVVWDQTPGTLFARGGEYTLNRGRRLNHTVWQFRKDCQVLGEYPSLACAKARATEWILAFESGRIVIR